MGLGNAKGLSQPPLHMQKEARGRWRSPVLVATLATLHRGQRLCGKLFLPPALPSLCNHGASSFETFLVPEPFSLSYLRIRIRREPLCQSCPLKVRVCNMHRSRSAGAALLPLLTFGSEERFTYAWEMSRSVTSDNSRLGLVRLPDTRVGIDRRTTSLHPIFEYLNLIK